mmetsp:Transcript_28853/g.53004  ORF Transcript_28853/g.53004 Transcript_28853/m.53004 type:complete len:191 (-) Transcript_28853:278-850(-)|eukprot:CAMPEP_0175079238 /NCGR_PEP_ID=MMETSP0052_2-20121109/24699_1 /TAXON_ID=51329 ORGANISM="Polytomella parva, Strain SAG 63-3" /NCGR_SAMPLE_ID=MMETSP0052_2 /ASSEMBLY_ACC=CAM_ASM_000194 /LENGTH=190 /DNA_ID=CAMNT_0016349521 /DNA_START=12 /DNA_END=584 /DNA_ORIENTATION=+
MQAFRNHAMPRIVNLQSLQELKKIKLDGLQIRFVDAKGVSLGSLAQQVSIVLQGKDKPTYYPTVDNGDVVVVVNAAHIYLPKERWDTLTYWWHTGYPGGAREITAREMWEKDPCQIIARAVNGMLPKNVMRINRMSKLKIFPEGDHPFTDLPLVPLPIKERNKGGINYGWSLPDAFQPANPDRFNLRNKI